VTDKNVIEKMKSLEIEALCLDLEALDMRFASFQDRFPELESPIHEAREFLMKALASIDEVLYK